MKAATFVAPGSPLAVVDIADPVPVENEVVIAVKRCGICGTDLHWTEEHDADAGWRPLPAGSVLGHEFAGEVVAVGKNAGTSLSEGDAICALPFIGCGACLACKAGKIYRCARVDTRGTRTLTGAYAEYARVGVQEAVRLPQGVGYDVGALVEPLAVGLAAAERAALHPGASIAVIGAGPVGLAVAFWCRFLGAGHVVMVDLVGARARRAAEFGATDFIDASAIEVVPAFTALAGAPPDVVFECVGLPGTFQQGIDLVANDGVLVVAGLCMAADTFLPTVALLKALDVRFTMCYERRHFETIVGYLDTGRIDASKFVTGVVGFADFSARFNALKTPGDDIKVLLDPGA